MTNEPQRTSAGRLLWLFRSPSFDGEIFSRGTRGGRNENPWNQKQSQTQPTRVKPNELLLLCVKVGDASSSHHTGKRLFLKVINSGQKGEEEQAPLLPSPIGLGLLLISHGNDLQSGKSHI